VFVHANIAGSGLVRGKPLRSVLREVYPDHEWQDWRFGSINDTLGKSVERQRRFFEDFMASKGMKELEDWYNVLFAQLRGSVGTAVCILLGLWYKNSLHSVSGHQMVTKHYRSSLPGALMAIFPEHEWHPWKFTTTPMSHWDNQKNRRQYFEWLEKHLGLKSKEDWYHVSSRVLRKNYGSPPSQ
jgi:hypothetical protein